MGEIHIVFVFFVLVFCKKKLIKHFAQVLKYSKPILPTLGFACSKAIPVVAGLNPNPTKASRGVRKLRLQIFCPTHSSICC